jgi:hypothetical protein
MDALETPGVFMKARNLRSTSFLVVNTWLASGVMCPSDVRGATFDVPQWLLSVGANESAFFFTVMNPFSDSHAIALSSPPASASGEYDFMWDGSAGVFQADTMQTAGGNPSLSASSSGNIRIQPLSSNLTIQIDGSYEYTLAGGDRTALMNFGISDVSAQQLVWVHQDVAQPIFGDPASGIVEVHHTLNLPSLPMGSVYSLLYTFRIQSFSGSPSAISTGAGSATFTVSPEPSSLWLLASVLVLHGRRHR